MEKFYYFFVFAQPYLPMPKFTIIPLQAVFGAIFLAMLFFRTLTPRSRPRYPLQKLFLLLFSWVCLADLLNLARIHTWDEFLHVAGRLVFLTIILATYSVVREREQYLKTLRVLMYGVLGLALITIVCAVFNINPFHAHMSEEPRSFFGVNMPFRRAIGIPKSYGEYGLILNSVLPLFLVSAWKKDFLVKRGWALLGIFVLLLAIFITQSRNVWLATFLLFAFFGAALALGTTSFPVKVVVGFGTAACLIIFAGGLLREIQEIFQGLVMGRQAHTYIERLHLQDITLELFKRHWMFGVGHEAITREIAQNLRVEAVVHNGYLDQLASTGIFGFIPFFAILLITFFGLVNMARKGPPAWRLWALCLAGSFVSSMSVLMGYKGFFSSTFAIEYGLFLSLVELCRQEEAGPETAKTMAGVAPFMPGRPGLQGYGVRHEI